MKTMVTLGCVFLASVFLVVSIVAQPLPYSLSGHILDNDNEYIVGADIILMNERTGDTLELNSATNGEYQDDAYNFAAHYTNGNIIRYNVTYGDIGIVETAKVDISKGGTKRDFSFPFCLGFVTSKGSYPSVAGTHKGTITPSSDISVSRLETRACEGTGGHAEYISLNGEEATWNGYNGDWSVLTFDNNFVLEKNKTYEYEIRTGSYPQIIHKERLEVPAGVITCDSFVDANEKVYKDGIPSIRLGEEI